MSTTPPTARCLASSRIAILDALLKLRQVCCDPGLVKLDAARKVNVSAKRARLLVLLEELVAEGRKVLVFSQFVEMLKLVERDIAARGWGYAMLHGGTKDRDDQIAAFQSGDRPLFPISLKAGGTGLNLTAADTVIVYDPWWKAVRGRGDRQNLADRLDPIDIAMLVDEGDHRLSGRSSSAWANQALALRRISFAWRSSRTSRSSALTRSFSRPQTEVSRLPKTRCSPGKACARIRCASSNMACHEAAPSIPQGALSFL